MCFRGMRELRDAWDAERREGILHAVIEEVIEWCDSEYLLYTVMFLQERYNTIVNLYPMVDDDLLDFVLRYPSIQINTRRDWVVHDVPTYMRYLMIPKTSYGVKSLRTLS